MLTTLLDTHVVITLYYTTYMTNTSALDSDNVFISKYSRDAESILG